MLALADLAAADLRGKRVLIREDLNAPLADGKIVSAKRLESAVAGARLALDAGARVMLMSHLGRPEEGRRDAALSLAPMADYLSRALRIDIKLRADYLVNPPQLAAGEAVMLENVRFNVGEKANDAQLAQQYAALCEVFVMDAFGAAHRAHASTCGVAKYARLACAGPLLLAEQAALGAVLQAPRRPLVAIIGGAKVSTKLSALEALSGWVDQLIPGGGVLNTFLAAAGHNIGRSLYEPALVPAAAALLRASAERGQPIYLPEDVVVAKRLDANIDSSVKAVGDIADDDMIFDFGDAAVKHSVALIKTAATIIWSGPLGVFETAQFCLGTRAVGRAIAESDAFSVAGGGDTVAAAERFGLTDGLSCVSTGGGAFLEFLEGKTLPAMAALQARAASRRHSNCKPPR